MIEIFKLKVECIKLKKQIAYCQKCKNKKQAINIDLMNESIDLLMNEYYQILNDYIENYDNLKKAKIVSVADILTIKKIYRQIARKIHPDLNKKFSDDEYIKELWLKTLDAYNANDLKKIEEIFLLVNKYLGDKDNEIVVDNIEEKLEQLKNSIAYIIDNEPYIYKFILESKETRLMEEDKLKTELASIEGYRNDLLEVLHEFEFERALA